MPRKYSSISVDTTLTATLAAIDTACTVADAAGLLGGVTIGAGDTFTVAIAPNTSAEEICIITAVSTNTLTITRAQGGTSAQQHEIGTTVRHVLTGIELTDFETVRTNFTTVNDNYISKTTVNAKGDLLVASANDTIARVAVGANGTVLTADSAETAGVKWVAVPVGETFNPLFLIGA